MRVSKIFKLNLFIILVVIVFSLGSNSVFAERELDYKLLEPSIFGRTSENRVLEDGALTYLRNAYNLVLAAAVILSVLMLVIAGVEYTAGGISESAKTDAKERIRAALVGLLIALFSYLLLRTLNPALVSTDSQFLQDPTVTAVDPSPPVGLENLPNAAECIEAIGQRYNGITENGGQFNAPALDRLITEIERRLEERYPGKTASFILGANYFTYDVQQGNEPANQAVLCHASRGRDGTVTANDCSIQIPNCSHARNSYHYGRAGYKTTNPDFYGSTAVDFPMSGGQGTNEVVYGDSVLEIATQVARDQGVTLVQSFCEGSGGATSCTSGSADHIHLAIVP